MTHARVVPKHHPPIYPAKYFCASPTFDKWCKLSAADIQALRTEAGFEGQNVYFHLNLPIRYAYITAPVVSIQDFAGGSLVTISLDDSSGSTIELKLNADKDDPLKTSVQNVSILSASEQFLVRIDNQPVEVGTVVKAKGTFTSFRGVRQIELKRIMIVKDTAEEIELWKAAAQFKKDFLSKPWILSAQEMQHLDKRLVEGQRLSREEEQRKRRHDEKRAKRRREREHGRMKKNEKLEKQRLGEERELNEGALI